MIFLGIGAAIIVVPVVITYPNVPSWIQPSLIIASVAAIFAGISALIANRSLKLTRNTQRPFLNVSRIHTQFDGDGVHPSPIRNFIIDVVNTGNYPADQVSIALAMCKRGDNNKHKLILQRQETTIYFPNEATPNLTFIEADNKDKIILNVGDTLQVWLEINYYNKLNQTEHKTIRSYLTEYNKTAQDNPIPVYEEDYWD